MARSALLFALLPPLGVFPLGPGIAVADDVPADGRAHYDKAQALYAKGDLKKAFSAISKGKAKCPDSVDFWHLYVRIWRGLEKKESTLQEKILAKAEAKNPGSTTFDMLRFRLADASEQRVEHLKAALEKKPKDGALRLLLAKEHLAAEDEDLAEELLEQVLEDEPANEAALVLKGDLMIASGFSRSAIDFAEETLADHDLPGLHDLVARALLLVAENDESAYEKALKEAEKAVAGRPDPGFVLTLATILDRTGEDEKAVALLTEHYGKTASPALGGRLGEMTFRTGEYDKAAKGLAVAAPRDRNAALALALCEARRGRAKQARAAVEHLLRHGKAVRLWASGVEMLLGDDQAALAHAAAGEGDWVEHVRALIAAEQGDAAAVVKAFGDTARDGSRQGEEWLAEVAQARLLEKLGGKAAAARKLLREARFAAAKAGTPTAVPPAEEPAVQALSAEYMRRHVSYRRALDGSFFVPGETSFAITFGDGVVVSSKVVVGASECPRDRQRQFRFNEKEKKMEGDEVDQAVLQELMQDMISADKGDWAGAEAAFQEGAAAFVDGEFAKASSSFSTAAEKEPGWARAKLFQAVAQVLGGGDVASASTLAAEAVKTLPEDWDGQEIAVLVHILAGKGGKAEAQALAEAQESFSTRRFAEFWDDEEDE